MRVLRKAGTKTNVFADPQGLNLGAVNAETDRRGFIPVDEKMRVLDKSGKAIPHLYCIGDANGKLMLAHAASAQVSCPLVTLSQRVPQSALADLGRRTFECVHHYLKVRASACLMLVCSPVKQSLACRAHTACIVDAIGQISGGGHAQSVRQRTKGQGSNSIHWEACESAPFPKARILTVTGNFSSGGHVRSGTYPQPPQRSGRLLHPPRGVLLPADRDRIHRASIDSLLARQLESCPRALCWRPFDLPAVKHLPGLDSQPRRVEDALLQGFEKTHCRLCTKLVGCCEAQRAS